METTFTSIETNKGGWEGKTFDLAFEAIVKYYGEDEELWLPVITKVIDAGGNAIMSDAESLFRLNDEFEKEVERTREECRWEAAHNRDLQSMHGRL